MDESEECKMDLMEVLDNAERSLSVVKGDYVEEGYIKTINALRNTANMDLFVLVDNTVWSKCDVIVILCRLLRIVGSLADLGLKHKVEKFLLQLREHKLPEETIQRYSERFRKNPEVAKEYVLHLMCLLAKDLNDIHMKILGRMFVGFVENKFENEEQFNILANINAEMFVEEYIVLLDILQRPVMLLNDGRLKTWTNQIEMLCSKGLVNPYIAGSFVVNETVYADISVLGKKFCKFICEEDFKK